MKQTYLKSFFITAIALPMVTFAEAEITARPLAEDAFIQREESSARLRSIHYLEAVSHFGDFISIEDGSQWIVDPSDVSVIADWKPQDPVCITQNDRWFSKYQFQILNQNTKSCVAANLHVGPIDDGKSAPSIIAIDTVQGELILSDGSQWQVSEYDESPFENWRLNDLIIIGHNRSGDSKSPYLLINVDTNHFVRAQQL